MSESAIKVVQKELWIGIAIAILGSIMFSTKAILVKVCYKTEAISSIELLSLRMLFSLPFYLFSLSKVESFAPAKPYWKDIVLLGVFGFYLSALFDFMGLRYISAGIERLILFLYPSFVVLFSLFFKKMKITGQQQIALLLTYCGIILAFGHEAKFAGNSTDFYYGSFLILLCSLTYAFFIYSSGNVLPKVGTYLFTNLVMVVSTVCILLQYVLTHPFHSIFQHSGLLYALCLVMAIFSTVLPSYLMSEGIKRIGSNNAAIVNSIGPISTIIQAYFILGEPFSLLQLLGTILVLLGVLWIGKK